MTDEPQFYSPRLADDPRPDPLEAGGERETLTAFLDWHRSTLELKCAGLDADRLSERAVPPSELSLHGLLRHVAGTERWWFRIQFAGEDVSLLHYADDDPDLDFHGTGGDPAQALAQWRREADRSREITAAAALEDTGIRKRTGVPVSLRAVLVHMIAEYARHNGHADLLRERLDGSTGM
ncbi:DinB family protein [Streptomonospora salina]|uniref:Putative damage-inducible protein DinB n=1 Tax=Streptomonospora salina TaxID=104205 RepID=A0A841EBF0_9ACTN|nr:DinB family protein [Streptomonospora salina]MBB5997820.1 putative damage-inducible protein DinB [Streptomonospora salina]